MKAVRKLCPLSILLFYTMIETFFLSLPNSLLCSSLLSHSDLYETGPSFDFAGVDRQTGFSQFSFNLFHQNTEDDRFCFRKLIDSKIFYHCAFVLLSGQTLVIKSDNVIGAKQLGSKFSLFVPFFKPYYYLITDSITVTNSLQYSIVVTKNLVGDNKKLVSILDLNDNTYIGEECHTSSFIFTNFGKFSDVSERALMISIYSKLKALSSSSIIAMAEFAVTSTSSDRVMSALLKEGFSKHDEPIIRYWIHSYFNNQKSKPILKTMSKCEYKTISF